MCLTSFGYVPIVLCFLCALPYFLRTGPSYSSFFINYGEKIQIWKNWGLRRADVRHSSTTHSLMKASSPTVGQTRLYSLCVEPIGEREAGDIRPTWLSSMECFLLRDWLLAGGGVGHLSRPLVVCELYGLPDEKKSSWYIYFTLFIITNREYWIDLDPPWLAVMQQSVVDLYCFAGRRRRGWFASF